MDNHAMDPSGNVGLAVGPDVTYVRARVTEAAENWSGPGGAEVDEIVILAKDLMKEVLRHNVEVLEEFPGSSLVGRSYEPLFPDAVQGMVQKLLGRFLKQTG
jgi:isoleucyl-tRNA synthetase